MSEEKSIKCVSDDCGHIEPAKGDERMSGNYFGGKRAVRGQGYMVMCSKCGCQTELI